ncbi:hypothetical protein NUW58_g6717 [Xylaria curta]|uniref:Uncharacterized protein n=1 Tax=Xylaria curta TaxID=42375 RepID=A0ACC1NSL1_9PEZI|nr:hypothetical protein NUW58_g6717 [Xylaria curta]
MSISIRDSIRWLPDAASEPTSTVVLTSPEHRFVDIRVIKDVEDPRTSLDWAFAGVSSSEDDGRTLETGRMVNPATGQLTDYEEIWTDIEAEAVPEANQKSENLIKGPGGCCVVVELKDEEREERGIAICLGRHFQGVVRAGERFTAERWLWDDGEWKCEYRVGELWMPGPKHMATLADYTFFLFLAILLSLPSQRRSRHLNRIIVE